MTVFSSRTDTHAEKNALTALVEAKKAAGTAVADLTESNPTRCGFTYLNQSWLAPLGDPGNLVYAPDPRGLLDTRKAVAGYYAEKGIKVLPEQIFLTSSTSEAYSFLFKLLCSPGERVLVPRPGYPLLDHLAALESVELAPYFVRYGEDGWRADLASLDEALARSAKAVVVVNPNNPTGHYLSDRVTFVDHCLKRNTPVISDEVFLDFPFEERQRQSLAGERRVLTFTLSGVSKMLGLPQMKLSWIVVNGPDALCKDALTRMELIADTFLSVNTPAQRALPVWLGERRYAIEEILTRVRKNRGTLLNTLAGGSGRGQLLDGHGGWYAVIALSGGLKDDAFALGLLEQRNVLVHPGYLFDFEDENALVISLLPQPEIFKGAVDKLKLSLGV